MAIRTYDWTEPEIVRLVQHNHTPDEVVVVTGEGAVQPSIVCSLCRTAPWPCVILLDLRAWLKEDHRKP